MKNQSAYFRAAGWNLLVEAVCSIANDVLINNMKTVLAAIASLTGKTKKSMFKCQKIKK